MRKTVDQYVATLPQWQHTIAATLRRAIRDAADELIEAIKWAIPVYEANGPVCYFKGHKNHLTFGFWRGAALVELDERLETSGAVMAHMKFREGDQVRSQPLMRLVKKAVQLNVTLGNPTAKRSSTHVKSRRKSVKR
jgi:hypothetical protein